MNFKGIKYDSNLDIKTIAKYVREEIKTYIKNNKLPKAKYSVTIDRYSMGQSLRIYVSNVISPKLMFNPNRIIWEKENPSEYIGNLNSFDPAFQLYTKEGKHVLNTLESIANQYQRDDSDSMTDYYSVNFGLTVEYEWSFKKEQQQLILDNIEAA